MIVKKKDTKSRIITVAVEIIGKEGNFNVTVRDIARRAEVNLASINYHYRSKDNLLHEVEQFFI
jgi:AcrR family transcriptional regulator